MCVLGEAEWGLVESKVIKVCRQVGVFGRGAPRMLLQAPIRLVSEGLKPSSGDDDGDDNKA